ncbi:Response regulator receiver domain protein [Roseimaritima ulvae]|uniref:Response regulator receiver domain protein n=1 Tax=Roseimaritima ulvae TaxID=980254 RepID=A0A5B9QL45_9BACT|nr:Response regulator receiver domain protein [Roseimaritima ulvae]
MVTNRVVRTVIVDAQLDAYRALPLGEAESSGLTLLDSGRAALQHSAIEPIEQWLINIHLPDMSGLELFRMLHTRHPKARFVLVGDVYQAEEERQTRTWGAAGYLCKPPQAWWLEPLQAEQRSDDGHPGISKPQSASPHRRQQS